MSASRTLVLINLAVLIASSGICSDGAYLVSSLDVWPGRERFCSVITDCAGGLGDDAVMWRFWRVRWAWPLLAVVLGAAGFGVGFWVGGWLGADVGVAVGVAIGSAAGGSALVRVNLAFSEPLFLRVKVHHRAARHALNIEGDLSSDAIRTILRVLYGDLYEDLVRRAVAELVQPGRLLFNPPDQMRLGQKERVEVRLTRSLDLDAELLEKLQGPGEPKLEDIETASRMAVTLTGDGFDIKSYSDEEQAVTQDGITTWEFDIRAKKGGKQQLFMSVSLRIPVPGQPLVHQNIPVREVTINVRITVPALAGIVFGDWRWVTATVIAIAAVIVAVFFH
jgi:hypothetical protein